MAQIDSTPAVTPHVLRHTFITNLDRGGMNVKAIGRIVGHSWENTTISTYIHIQRDDMRRALENSTINQVLEPIVDQVVQRLQTVRGLVE